MRQRGEDWFGFVVVLMRHSEVVGNQEGGCDSATL